MTERDEELVMIVSERFERRLAEETGKLRVDMVHGFGALEIKMSDRNAELLKWLLIFWATQTAALATLIALLK